MVHFGEFFLKPEACGQTVLPDMSVLIGQKLVENAKIKKFKCDILSNFQTMWSHFLNEKSCLTKQSKSNFLNESQEKSFLSHHGTIFLLIN